MGDLVGERLLLTREDVSEAHKLRCDRAGDVGYPSRPCISHRVDVAEDDVRIATASVKVIAINRRMCICSARRSPSAHHQKIQPRQ